MTPRVVTVEVADVICPPPVALMLTIPVPSAPTVPPARVNGPVTLNAPDPPTGAWTVPPNRDKLLAGTVALRVATWVLLPPSWNVPVPTMLAPALNAVVPAPIRLI